MSNANVIAEFLERCETSTDENTSAQLTEAKTLLKNLQQAIATHTLDLSKPSNIPPCKQEVERACRGIGHDFNGVLANVRGLVEITQMMFPDLPEKVHETLTKINTIVDRGHHSTEQFRMYGKVLHCDKVTFNMQQRTRRLVNDVRMHFNVNFKIASSCPEGLSVSMDEVQLETITMQIAKNALQAMAGTDRDPQLSIVVTQDPKDAGAIYLTISDNGKGIASDVGDKVYYPFYSTKKAVEGIGLGLSIAKQIVMNHDGHIRYESESNVGTRFIMWLPVVANV